MAVKKVEKKAVVQNNSKTEELWNILAKAEDDKEGRWSILNIAADYVEEHLTNEDLGCDAGLLAHALRFLAYHKKYPRIESRSRKITVDLKGFEVEKAKMAFFKDVNDGKIVVTDYVDRQMRAYIESLRQEYIKTLPTKKRTVKKYVVNFVRTSLPSVLKHCYSLPSPLFSSGRTYQEISFDSFKTFIYHIIRYGAFKYAYAWRIK
jgi:hypothetical protein